MPSPAILCSKSAADITSQHSPSHFKLPPSSMSFRSTCSTGSPVTAWSKKLGEYIKGDKKNSNLTAESLQEFNRRNALIEARYNTSSPYYKGLTDFSLVINREKLSGSSPGRESHAASFITSGSKSSLFVKVQGWGSACFTSKNHEKGSSSLSFFGTRSSHDACANTSFSSWSSKTTENAVAATKIKTKTTRNDSESESKYVTLHSVKSEGTIASSTKEKPLRERNSEPLPMMPLPPLIAQLPESLPYTLPPITPPTAQSFPTPTPLSKAQTTPTSVQKPAPQTPSAGRVTCENKEKNMTENERQFMWADKYRPFLLQDFLCNRRAALELQTIIRNFHDKGEDCGHFIFEGNPGVGKRTMIWALLREAFGPDKVQAREECKKFYLKGEAVGSILVTLMVSPKHTEVNLSELKGYEKHVIFELIKEKNQKLSDTVLHGNRENCRAIILYEADKLSTDALSYIKWMLEKFKGCNKVFFCCSDASKLQSIKPLCRFIQLHEPSNEEILKVLAFIANQEGIELPHQLATKIANNSRNNLRQAIRSFEATWNSNRYRSSLEEARLIQTGWEDKIANIARNVVEEQSPKQLYNIRRELQNLIEHNVAPGFIFQALTEELKMILPQQLRPQFDKLYDEYQKNHATVKYLASAHQQEESGKRQNDPRKNVQQFMRIEEKLFMFQERYGVLPFGILVPIMFPTPGTCLSNDRVYSKIHELVQRLGLNGGGLTRRNPGSPPEVLFAISNIVLFKVSSNALLHMFESLLQHKIRQ